MKLLVLTATSILVIGTARAQTAMPYQLSAEPANAAMEEALFPQLPAARASAVRTARTGQAAVRLTAQPQPATLVSALLPVQAGQQLTVTIYARAARAPRRWLVPAAQALVGSLVMGAAPAEPISAEAPVPATRRIVPYLGLGFSTALPRATRRAAPPAGAYVQYRLYDQAGTYLSSGQQSVSLTSDDWQPVRLAATVNRPGFVQLVLGNASREPVWFDDLEARLDPALGTVVAVLSVQERRRTSLPAGGATTNTAIPVIPVWGEGGGGPGPGFPGGDPTYPLDGVTVTAPPPPPPPVYIPPAPGNPPPPPSNPTPGGGGGGAGPMPTIHNTIIIVGECEGLKTALKAQASDNKEVVGYTTNDGNVILLPMDKNTAHTFSVSFPLFDDENHLVTNGPFEEDGVWKIDMTDWTNGHQVKEYIISYAFHTHPMEEGWDYNNPSPADYNNAKKYIGITERIITNEKVIEYDTTKVTKISDNACK